MLPLIIGGIAAIVLIFVAVILGTAVGAFTGWILSLFFLGDWIIAGFQVFGYNTQGKLVVIGSMLGFLSGFIKTTANKGKGD